MPVFYLSVILCILIEATFVGIVIVVVWPVLLPIAYIFSLNSSSARANITLSGKKKRKLLKQLAHMGKEKSGMDGMFCVKSWIYKSVMFSENSCRKKN